MVMLDSFNLYMSNESWLNLIDVKAAMCTMYIIALTYTLA